MRIAAFTRYGRRAASTRQRFLQYLPALRAARIEVDHHPLLDDDYVAHLGTGEPYPSWRIARAYAQRFNELRGSRNCDVFWVYVELFPYIPATLELLTTIGKPIVYDFDDAFFHVYDQSRNPMLRSLLARKHGSLLRRAAGCACGNAYLLDYAKRFCSNSFLLPTVVDTEVYFPVQRRSPQVTIGWIGSPSTWPNVRPLLPLLEELVRSHELRFRVVGAGRSAEQDLFPGMELIEWSEVNEVADVQAMDIGIMPLVDLPFERGKSGYKLVQYMACGLPVVASPVGVNSEIVTEGENGFLASGVAEWRSAITCLIQDPELRRRLGQSGRERVETSYSLESRAPTLIRLFEALGGAN